MLNKFIMILLFVIIKVFANECAHFQNDHPEWVFCDDFEDTASMTNSYFEYNSSNGTFLNKDGCGLDGSRGMEGIWKKGQVGAGSLALSIGKNPNSYMNKNSHRSTDDFREIYYRMYVKMARGWNGSPYKLSRITVFTSQTDWRQAMIAHLWSDDSCRLSIDPATCIDETGGVICTTYNDFKHLKWLGQKSGVIRLFADTAAGKWFCIEHHVRLNDPGKVNGVQEFWIDGALQARREGLNFNGTFTTFGLNALFFENYWNGGAPQENTRYFDNIVVSTKRIGCLEQKTGVKHDKENIVPKFSAIVRNDELVIDATNIEKCMHLSLHTITGRCFYKQRNVSGRISHIPLKKAGVYTITVITPSYTMQKKIVTI